MAPRVAARERDIRVLQRGGHVRLVLPPRRAEVRVEHEVHGRRRDPGREQSVHQDEDRFVAVGLQGRLHSGKRLFVPVQAVVEEGAGVARART